MRLAAGLLLAGVLALLVGIAAVQIVGAMPCHGEGLACNLDQAIGAYAVPIWVLAGLIVFAVIALLARKRVTLASGMVLLLAPLAAFALAGLIEVWQAFGLQPYPDLRQALTIFAPAALTVVTQWLVLRTVLGRRSGATEKVATTKAEGPAAEMGKPGGSPPELPKTAGSFPPFPTE